MTFLVYILETGVIKWPMMKNAIYEKPHELKHLTEKFGN